MVQLNVVGDEADLVRAALLGDEVAAGEPVRDGILIQLPQNAFADQVVAESAAGSLQVGGDGAGVVGMVRDDRARLEVYLEVVALHPLVGSQVVIQYVWEFLKERGSRVGGEGGAPLLRCLLRRRLHHRWRCRRRRGCLWRRGGGVGPLWVEDAELDLVGPGQEDFAGGQVGAEEHGDLLAGASGACDAEGGLS